jgi:hypothetical protein
VLSGALLAACVFGPGERRAPATRVR